MEIAAITKPEIQQGVAEAIEVLAHYLPDFTHAFRAASSVNNFYSPTPNIDWTTGFNTGEYWLAWQLSEDDAFKSAALVQVDSFARRIRDRVEVEHHDMGFLYTPSCVAAYMLTGSETARQAAIAAADVLCERYQEKGRFLQAWGKLGAPDNYRLIIDCLMNLPLLYWASEETGSLHYRAIAENHTQTALSSLVRPDFSTYHTFYFNPETGAPVRGVTAQGYRDGSAWARGQAWGIYGLALAYKYTRDEGCVKLFEPVTSFFNNRLPQDLVPYWDLDFTAADGEPRDSSAAAIAACGMLEMAKYLPQDRAAAHTQQAQRIAGSLARHYAVRSARESNGLLLHGVYAKKSPYNTVSNSGVDECNPWGDYFWLELLTRLSTNWDPYW